MTSRKVTALKEVLFKNKNEIMAIALGTSQSKISLATNGKQGLSIESIITLLTTYKVDPTWFFKAEDDEPPVFVGVEISELERKYYTAVEKISILQDELVGYQKKEIQELKHPDTDGEPTS